MHVVKKDDGAEGDRQNLRLELIALTAALVILVCPFLYRFLHNVPLPTQLHEAATFVGRDKCKKCHLAIYEKWQGSDHDLAMDQATEKSVLGDFNNAVFTDPHNGVSSRFYRQDGRFFVETEGPDGKPGQFEIRYTFGAYPLQQYLVPFPGGRLQCLNIAWDVERRTWYRLPPYEVKGTDDWLHWTKGGQTWNGMCAECHSTRLTKGFDIETESYKTSWFEIDIGCEACHGPGSKHVNWADQPPFARSNLANYGLTVTTGNLDAKSQVALCAPCHSRRFQLGDNHHDQGQLLDIIVPSLLEEGLYYADGQILEEVYVYGSFTQSKMYMHGVRCSDCHDPHSLQPHREKNELCLQCHRAEVYNTELHHFHKRYYEGKPSEGFLCVKCHMPGREYMGIDYRPDHSIRIPRPDLSAKLGTPNSCSARDCHADKPLQWSIDHYSTWYGTSRKPHYGTTLAAGRKRTAEAAPDLIRLSQDPLLPPIVRATALSLLRSYPGEESLEAFKRALEDEEGLLRYTAIRNMDRINQETRLSLIAPKLYDPVKAVRIEAALQLSTVPEQLIRKDDLTTYRKNLEEYRQAMLYNSDFAAQRYNLGNLESNLGAGDKAEKYYNQAIAIDNQFYPAKVNLAMYYNRIGKNTEAKTLLMEVVQQQPELYEVAYSLGLLLAEMNDFEEAAKYLEIAADGMPGYSRPRYNQALSLLKLKRWTEGEEALFKALQADPGNAEYFVALANLYLNFREKTKARSLCEWILHQSPDHEQARDLLELLNKQPE